MEAINDTRVDSSTKVENIFSTCQITERLKKMFKKVAVKTGKSPLLDDLPTQIVHALCDNNATVVKEVFDLGLLSAGLQDNEARNSINLYIRVEYLPGRLEESSKEGLKSQTKY